MMLKEMAVEAHGYSYNLLPYNGGKCCNRRLEVVYRRPPDGTTRPGRSLSFSVSTIVCRSIGSRALALDRVGGSGCIKEYQVGPRIAPGVTDHYVMDPGLFNILGSNSPSCQINPDAWYIQLLYYYSLHKFAPE